MTVGDTWYKRCRPPSRSGEKPEVNLPNFPNVDLFSAGINALNGVIVARDPSHNRGYTVAGLLIMGFFGGIGGGVSRDLMLNVIPAPFQDPKYLYVCVLMGLLGLAIYRYADSKAEVFHMRLREYLKSFSLPWFAILGSHKALEHGLGFFGAILVGLIATTAGGVMIDLFSRITPIIVRADEQHATTAVLASTVYTLIALHLKDSQTFFPVTLVAVLVAFTFRVCAVRGHWASIVPYNPPPDAPGADPVARV
jgi:uncharacterized membrane protein YeiH